MGSFLQSIEPDFGDLLAVTGQGLIARLEEEAPEVLRASIPEVGFERTVEELLKESPSSEPQHFYCRKCGEYHQKTHRH